MSGKAFTIKPIKQPPGEGMALDHTGRPIPQAEADRIRWHMNHKMYGLTSERRAVKEADNGEKDK